MRLQLQLWIAACVVLIVPSNASAQSTEFIANDGAIPRRLVDPAVGLRKIRMRFGHQQRESNRQVERGIALVHVSPVDDSGQALLVVQHEVSRVQIPAASRSR